MTHRTTTSASVAATPDSVFAQITDLGQLPRWNTAITEVVETPTTLAPGSVWKVRIHAMGTTWISCTEAQVIDDKERRFTYRSQSDDGNPSYADWEWHIQPSSSGALVTVSVALAPLTFWRKYLLVHFRSPDLRREIRSSLAALEHIVVTDA